MRDRPLAVAASLAALVIATTCDGDGAGERACVGLGELCEAAPWSRSWAWERTAGSFADIDGDGVLDFVIASPASGLTIRWGDEFGDAYLHLLAGGAADARAVDVDDDGDLDVVLATESAPQLRVLENTGSRSFVESRAVTLPGAAQGLWIGPLRPGGDPRVVAATRVPGGLHVLDRRLAPIHHAAFGRALGPLAAGDLDGDGAVDFVIVDEEDHAIRVVHGDGDGGLGTPLRIASAPAPTSIDLADLDGDGDLDAIVGSGGGVVWIHRGDGAGGFAQAEAITIAAARNPGRGVAGISAKDGAPGWIVAPDRPFVVAAEVGPDLGLGRRVVSDYLGVISGLHRVPEGVFVVDERSASRLDLSERLTFVESWRGPASGDDEEGRIAGGDLDQAHDLDLAVVEGKTLTVYLATAAGGWSPSATIDLPEAPLSIAVAEVTGDGRADLLLGVALPAPAVYAAIGDGAGSFVLGPANATPLEPRRLTPIRRADLGRDALAITSGDEASADGLHVLGFDEAGAVIDDRSLLPSTAALQVRAADVDDDGHEDLIAAIQGGEGEALVILRSTGDGGFEGPEARSLAALDPAPDPESWLPGALLVVGDLDEDGGDDAILVSGATTVRVLGLADLATSEVIVDPQGWSCDAGVVADVDDDDDPDVVCAGDHDSALLLDPASTPLQLLLGNDHYPDGPSSAVLVDADGAPLVAQIGPRGLAVSRVAVAPTLETAADIYVAEPMRRIALGDLDGDGRQDLAAIAYDRVAALWHPSPAAAVAGEFAFSYELTGINLADVDGDGDLEIVVGDLRGRVEILDVVDGHLVTRAYLQSGLVHAFAGVPLLPRADGPADLLLAGRSGHDDASAAELRVLPRLADGSFADAPIVLWESGAPAKAARFIVGDFDGDRFGDVALFFDQAGPVSIVWGSAARIPEVTTLVVAAPVTLGAGDLDGDGRDELLIQDGADAVAVAFVDRIAGAPRTFARGEGVRRPIFTADLDGDGVIDVVRVIPAGLQLLRGPVLEDSPRALLRVPEEDRITDVALADVDGDGILDVAANYAGGLRIWSSAPRP